jgi:hypothetical protein
MTRQVTDEMVAAAAMKYERTKSMRSALIAADALAPDRYREGFEAAREMAAAMFDYDGTEWWRSGAAIARCIRAMEMPE